MGWPTVRANLEGRNSVAHLPELLSITAVVLGNVCEGCSSAVCRLPPAGDDCLRMDLTGYQLLCFL